MAAETDQLAVVAPIMRRGQRPWPRALIFTTDMHHLPPRSGSATPAGPRTNSTCDVRFERAWVCDVAFCEKRGTSAYNATRRQAGLHGWRSEGSPSTVDDQGANQSRLCVHLPLALATGVGSALGGKPRDGDRTTLAACFKAGGKNEWYSGGDKGATFRGFFAGGVTPFPAPQYSRRHGN